ncbi:MAG: hypothetical protein Q8P46_18685 [Hyphomicrobiales bacterium]|nr:hypothetical protein [Hyphomicrobiales bacterium]
MSDVPLKEHIEAQISWLDRHFQGKIEWLDRHFASQIRKIDDDTSKAASQIDKRLEGMNEFRDTLKDQAGNFSTKDEVRLQINSLNEKVRMLELGKANTDGKTLIVSGLIAFIASALVVFISRWILK